MTSLKDIYVFFLGYLFIYFIKNCFWEFYMFSMDKLFVWNIGCLFVFQYFWIKLLLFYMINQIIDIWLRKREGSVVYWCLLNW
jgi:hypothetical protein